MIISDVKQKPFYTTTTSGVIDYTYENYRDGMIRIRKGLGDVLDYDYICGVARGGLIPAIELTHIYNLPLYMVSCQLRDYDGDKTVNTMPPHNLLWEANVLMVEDIIDSGETVRLIERTYGRRFDWACLVWNKETEIYPVAYGVEIARSTCPEWYKFWWEK